MTGRKLVLMALALVALGLSALAATRGLPFHRTESLATSCSSCDARHQSHKRIAAGR
jgi:hypothetical protein